MSVQSMIATIPGIAMVGLLSIVAIQHHLLGETRDQLSNAQRELVTVKLTVVELERDAVRTAERETARQTAREVIVSAPEGDNGAISPLLFQGLRAADFIGGAK